MDTQNEKRELQAEQSHLFESGFSDGQEPPRGKESKKGVRRPRVCYVNRKQEVWDSYVIDDLVVPTHEARAIWEFVGSLNLSGYYAKIRSVEGSAGRSTHDPQVLLSLWIYAYSKGESSARELARLTESAPAYRWLCGNKPVNYHTLSDFRTAHGEQLIEMFAEILGVLSAEGLVSLERVMHDGTKVKALASGDRFRRGETLEVHLEKAREQVKVMQEQGDDGEPVSVRVKRRRERVAREKLERLQAAQQQLKKIQAGKPQSEQGKVRVSESDPDCRETCQVNCV